MTRFAVVAVLIGLTGCATYANTHQPENKTAFTLQAD